MSRIGDFADDDAAGWITRSPDIGIPMAGFTNAVYTKNRLPMRTRELAKFLDDMLKSELDIFAKLDAPLEQRLIATYRNVEVDPPIHCDALLEWIEKHPGGPAVVDVAALETIVAVGTTKPKVAEQLAVRLLETPEESHRIRVIQAVGRGRMTSLAKTLLSRLQSATANDNERRAIEAALARLKQN